MKCINCGSELPEGAKFCMNCGALQVQSAPNPTSSAPSNSGKKYAIIAGVLGILAIGLITAIVIILVGQNYSTEPIAASQTVLSSQDTKKEEETEAVSDSETSTETIAIPSMSEALESSETPSEQTEPQEVPTFVSESTSPAWTNYDLPDGSHSEVPEDCLADIEAFIYSSDKNMWWNQLSLSAGGDKKTLEGADFYENFYSYNTSIATVSENGIVTGVNPGTTYIVADKGINGFSGRIQVRVFIVKVQD